MEDIPNKCSKKSGSWWSDILLGIHQTTHKEKIKHPFVLGFRLKVVDWYSKYYQLSLIRAIHEKWKESHSIHWMPFLCESIQQFIKSFNPFDIQIFENPNSTNEMYTLMIHSTA